MKNQKALWVVVIAMALVCLLATACDIADTTPTNDNDQTVAPTEEPTQAPTQEPTQEPTQAPAFALSDCLLIDRTYPSYDAFFSQDRQYWDDLYHLSWWKFNGTTAEEYSLICGNTEILIKRGHDDTAISIPCPESFRYPAKLMGTDGRYLYSYLPTQITRLDMLDGSTDILCTAEEILTAHLRGDAVIYYAAVEDGNCSLQRLYLPTRQLDILYEFALQDTPVDNYWFYLYEPKSTLGDLRWHMMNPAMMAEVKKAVQDPNSPLQTQRDFAEFWKNPSLIYEQDVYWLCNSIQDATGIRAMLEGTYNCATGTYSQRLGEIGCCWRGSDWGHDHFEPETTYLPAPTILMGEWVNISPSVTLPSSPTADEMYAEADDFNEWWAFLYADSFGPGYLYASRGNDIRKLLDIPVLERANSKYYVYCITADNRLLQLSYDGSVCNTLYTPKNGQLRNLSYYGGKLYVQDGDTAIELDVPALKYRTLLKHAQMGSLEYWYFNKPHAIYLRVAKGAYAQQYFFDPVTGELKKTSML